MATEILMRMHPSGTGLVPADDQELNVLQELPFGVLNVTVTQKRHPMFHRKVLKLFRELFNMWEPGELTVDGVPVKKDFESFREHLTIQAGHYKQVFLPGGGFELRAASISYAKVDNIKFQQIYSNLIDVGLRLLGKAEHMTTEEVDAAVERLMEFAR